jgi:uncharacterized HAD superfamily protein
MKCLTIGVDIDGVIVDIAAAMLPLLSEICKRPVSYQDLCYWNLGEALNIDQETVAYIWEKTLGDGLLRQAPPIKGALEGMSMISGHNIWLVTRRPAYTRNFTQSWLSEYGVKYDHIAFVNKGKKASMGQTFDLFVEDYLEEALAFAEAGVFSILFNQPWNQASISNENCLRVHDWKSIVSIIKKIEIDPGRSPDTIPPLMNLVPEE